MEKELIDKATELAKNNKESFNFSLLKKELHIGTITCNLLLDELEKLGMIVQQNKHGEGKYKIEVLL